MLCGPQLAVYLSNNARSQDFLYFFILKLNNNKKKKTIGNTKIINLPMYTKSTFTLFPKFSPVIVIVSPVALGRVALIT